MNKSPSFHFKKVPKRYDTVSEILRNSLYLSGVSFSSDISRLKKAGIDVIVTCVKLPSSIYDFCECHEFLIRDCRFSHIGRMFESVGDVLHSKLAEGKKVLVCCHLGKSRSTTLVISYLMKFYYRPTKKYLFRSSYGLVKSKRPVTNPNIGFIEQLKKYEKILNLKNFVNTMELSQYFEETPNFSNRLYGLFVQVGWIPKSYLRAMYNLQNPRLEGTSNGVCGDVSYETESKIDKLTKKNEKEESSEDFYDSEVSSSSESSSSSSESEEEELEEEEGEEEKVEEEEEESLSRNFDPSTSSEEDEEFANKKHSKLFPFLEKIYYDRFKSIKCPCSVNGVIHSTSVDKSSIDFEVLTVHHVLEKGRNSSGERIFYEDDEIGFFYVICVPNSSTSSKLPTSERIGMEGWNHFSRSKCKRMNTFEFEWSDFDVSNSNPIISFIEPEMYAFFLTPSQLGTNMKKSSNFELLNLRLSISNDQNHFNNLSPFFKGLYETKFGFQKNELDKPIPKTREGHREDKEGEGEKAREAWLLLGFSGDFNSSFRELFLCHGFYNSPFRPMIDRYMNDVMKKKYKIYKKPTKESKREEEEEEGEEEEHFIRSIHSFQGSVSEWRKKMDDFFSGVRDVIDRFISVTEETRNILMEEMKEGEEQKMPDYDNDTITKLQDIRMKINSIFKQIEESVVDLIVFYDPSFSKLLDHHSRMVLAFSEYKSYQKNLTKFLYIEHQFVVSQIVTRPRIAAHATPIKSMKDDLELISSKFEECFISKDKKKEDDTKDFRDLFFIKEEEEEESTPVLFDYFPSLKKWIKGKKWKKVVKKLRKHLLWMRASIVPRSIRFGEAKEPAMKECRGFISEGDSGGSVGFVDVDNKVLWVYGIIRKMKQYPYVSRLIEYCVDCEDERIKEFLS